MESKEAKATSTQRGRACELLLAGALLLAGGGRLSPFVTLADDDGLDLLLLDKPTGATLPLQAKGWTEAPLAYGTVQFDLKVKTLREQYHSALLLVRVDPDTNAIVQSWLVPMSDITQKLGLRPSKGKYALCPSTKADSRDRFRKYRKENLRELVAGILLIMEARQGLGGSSGVCPAVRGVETSLPSNMSLPVGL